MKKMALLVLLSTLLQTYAWGAMVKAIERCDFMGDDDIMVCFKNESGEDLDYYNIQLSTRFIGLLGTSYTKFVPFPKDFYAFSSASTPDLKRSKVSFLKYSLQLNNLRTIPGCEVVLPVKTMEAPKVISLRTLVKGKDGSLFYCE